MSHISSSGGGGGGTPGELILHVTLITSAQSPYTVLLTDSFIGVDTSGGPVTVLLPDFPVLGRTFIIKDDSGNAATNNITVTTVSGIDSIDGISSFTMNTNLQAAQFIYAALGTYYIY